MIHSQNFDVTIEDDFSIWFSISLLQDFTYFNTNIKRVDLLKAYVSQVYELYQQEKQLDSIIECFEAQEG
jgi:hypothetical protein